VLTHTSLGGAFAGGLLRRSDFRDFEGGSTVFRSCSRNHTEQAVILAAQTTQPAWSCSGPLAVFV